MTRLQQILIFINYFSLGILVPMLNLILLERGASLQTLPLLLGIYSVTTLCLELPSGICADIYGRKRMFLVSTVFTLVSLILILWAKGMVWLVFAMIANGLSRAFSSGSLDALFIDEAILRHGESCLTGVTTRMSILESTGLGIGAIVGGLIANSTDSYLINIVLRIVLTLMLFALCWAYIKEQSGGKYSIVVADSGKKKEITFAGHLREGKRAFAVRQELSLIFIGVLFLGFFLCVIEVFWQPAYMEISNSANSKLLLGVITFLGFFATPLGNIAVKKILDNHPNRWWEIYVILRVLFASCIIIFAIQESPGNFVASYTLIYLMLGSSGLAEMSLINKYTPSHMRASMLSLSSLMVQIGFLIGSLFSTFMVLKLQFSGLWIVSGVLLGSYAVIAALVKRKWDQKSKRKALSLETEHSI